VERAQHLLAGTDLAMPAVAKKSGFISAERLSVIFRQETGMTPTSYRRQFRLHEEGEGE
jgi:transcriptional regulator GlxA family with amidase domain